MFLARCAKKQFDKYLNIIYIYLFLLQLDSKRDVMNPFEFTNPQRIHKWSARDGVKPITAS